MGKIIMMIERSKDYFDAYSDNCDGIYAAGSSIDDVKADAEKAIRLIKENLPENDEMNLVKFILVHCFGLLNTSNRTGNLYATIQCQKAMN